MQIFTVQDAEFNELLSTWKDAQIIGRFWTQGRVREVRAADRLVLISPDDLEEKIAIRPARELVESIRLAKQFLKREEKRGSKVEYI